MKKIIFTIFLITILGLCGCAEAYVSNDQNTPNDVILQVPPTLDNEQPEDSENNVDEEEQKRKAYAVSKTNGLRIRSLPNSTSQIVGSLDKNDAVLYIEKVGEYVKTTYKEKTAYVHSSYCKIMQVEIADENIERAIDQGSALLGHPYVWGSQRYHWGNGVLNKNFVSGEFDCSALVQYVYYKSNKILLDVTSRSQAHNGIHVEKSGLKRGDLMFFTNASRKNLTGNERIGHVGIYFGNNYILHTASDHAVIEPISTTRWSYYITARRVV